MTAPFAALEASVNDAVRRHLANATADFGGGVVVDVEFGKQSADAFGIVAGSALTLRVVSVLVPGIGVDDSVSISGTAYTIVHVDDDGSGMITMRLEEA
jgi:hypothetical protein